MLPQSVLQRCQSVHVLCDCNCNIINRANVELGHANSFFQMNGAFSRDTDGVAIAQQQRWNIHWSAVTACVGDAAGEGPGELVWAASGEPAHLRACLAGQGQRDAGPWRPG